MTSAGTVPVPEGVTLRDRFTGKEDQSPDFGLAYADFGARQYSPALRRWLVPDPQSEKYYGISPYSYCGGDPVNLVDPDGRELVIWYKENGHLVPYCYNGGECNSSNSFVQAVVTAYHYNKANWYFAGCSGKSQTEIAVERKEQINVIIADLVGDRFSNTYNTIYWNPETGTQNENGTVTSPATDFDHEADHANAAIDGIRAESNEKEESRVIGGSEQQMAKANGDIKPGQVTRNNHKGKIVVTNGVTSNVIDQKKTKEYDEKQRTFNPFAQD